MLSRMVDEALPPPASPVVLTAAHPLYAVDFDQRIVAWDERASQQLRAGNDLIGRRCYEVLASIDPRNAALCRPNCPAITQARVGRPAPDFEVWAQTPAGDPSRVRVSILLQEDGCPTSHAKEHARVIHMIRPVEDSPPDPLFGGRGRQRSGLRASTKHCAVADFTESGPPITSRQVAALRLLAEGYSPEEIAAAMEVRPITVRNHIQAAMDRLGARSRLEAVIIASRAGLLEGA